MRRRRHGSGHRTSKRPGFWSWFADLPALSKIGFLNLSVQLGLAVFALVAPQVAAATLGGAALGFGAKALGIENALIAGLKSSAPALAGMVA